MDASYLAGKDHEVFFIAMHKTKVRNMIMPELLAPAGSLDKLKVSVDYGADAVYLGGLKFGLRSAAENFTLQELEEGVAYAHQRGAKVYVVLNGFLHDEDLSELGEFVDFLEEQKIDAVIASDLGVIQTVKKRSNIPVHLSTQASCLNVESAKFWKKQGVERVVLGREVSIKEAGKIKREAGVEVEMFVHGSMCMAYSGNCVISNFTQGRDSNRGGCAHSCRFEYSLKFESEEEKRRSYFMSSKDLNGLAHLEEFIKEEIDSIKVEGRMKSHLYAGTISKVYSEALRYYKEHGNFLSEKIYEWEEELKKVTHRAYADANLVEKAAHSTIFNERETSSENEYILIGNVIEASPEKFILVDVRNSFEKNQSLELLPFSGECVSFECQEILGLDNEEQHRTKPSSLVKLPWVKGAAKNNILRARIAQ